MGFNFSRETVGSATDPIQAALRWRGQVVHRQPYYVPGPNSLWHLGMFLYGKIVYLLTLTSSHTRWPP